MKHFSRVRNLEALDKAKKLHETALNDLESFILDVKMKLDTDQYTAASKPEEVEKLLSHFNDASEWYEEQSYDADTQTLHTKLSELKKLTEDLFARVWEHTHRPDELKAVDVALNRSRIFSSKMKELNATSGIFTPVEMQTLDRVINETQVRFCTICVICTFVRFHKLGRNFHF